MPDREKLIELIQSAVKGCATYWAGLIADHLIANGVTIQKWIPVTERLPEDYENVLVYSGVVEPGWCSRGIFYEHDKYESDQIYGVTHWMPLPEPPREVEE